MQGAPKATPPSSLAWINRASSATDASEEITGMVIEFPSFHPRRAKTSRLRSAYLASFAVFGYRYAARLATVRRQIADPRSEHIRNFHVGLGASDRPSFMLYSGKADEIGDCLVAAFGVHGVVLPPPSNLPDGEFWATLTAHASEGLRFQFSGSAIGWPREPLHLLDD